VLSGVIHPSISALTNELTDARLEVETLVFARAVEHGGLQWASQLVAAHYWLENTTYLTVDEPLRITDEWADAHARFHEALLEGCDNRRLYQMAIGLRSEAELYRRWSQPLGSEKNRDLAAEHRRLLDAALAHNVNEAKRALREHISHTTRLLLDASSCVS
jgi:DNA-binding GntR family transcriptional regulator